MTFDSATRKTTARAIRAARSLAPVLGRDRRGVTVIEFGFVVGPLIALIVATLQTSITFFAQQNLETTAERSVRQLITGEGQKNNLTQAAFKDAVCANLPDFMKKNCANVLIDVQVVTDFSSADTASPTITYDAAGNINNAWQFKPGAPGQITVAKIMYQWDVAKGPLGFDLSNMSNKKRLLIATSVFQTEPY